MLGAGCLNRRCWKFKTGTQKKILTFCFKAYGIRLAKIRSTFLFHVFIFAFWGGLLYKA